MDISLAIRQGLEQQGMEQRDLAAAARVTESYISQLLSGKKPPPAPKRTDIYERIGKALKFPSGKLATIAELQRNEDLKRKVIDPPAPLFREVRQLILRKCNAEKVNRVSG